MEKLEIKAVIKYFCKKGMPPKEIHKDFNMPLEHIRTLCGNVSASRKNINVGWASGWGNAL